MPASDPCIVSPIKYCFKGPLPLSSFKSAMYYSSATIGISDASDLLYTPRTLLAWKLQLMAQIKTSQNSSQYRDITKDRFERLVEDVRHLVLEILGGD
jgi:hypothetical protein